LTAVLCFVPPLCLVAPTADSGLPLSFEVGYQLEVFSESFGSGDLFFDLDDVLDPTQEDESFRIRSDEVLHGSYVDVVWEPDPMEDRRVDFDVELNERDATADLEMVYAVKPADGWSITGDGRSRTQFGLKNDDDSRDVLLGAGAEVEREISWLGELTLRAEHELSRVSGDSLSQIYDYDLTSISGKFSREIGRATGVLRLERAYRHSPNDASTMVSGLGDYERTRAELQAYRYAFDGWDYDVRLSGAMRDYDETVASSPSNREGIASLTTSRDIGRDLAIVTDGEYQIIDYEAQGDDVSSVVYYDYIFGRAEVGLSWFTLAGLSAELWAGGEWLRPKEDAANGYDQSRVRIKAGYVGLGDLWVDLEESMGYRNYLGTGSSAGFLTGEGAFSLDSSDFFYSETTLLASFAWRRFVADATAQYSIENHDSDADDVAFLLLNMRLGMRF